MFGYELEPGLLRSNCYRDAKIWVAWVRAHELRGSTQSQEGAGRRGNLAHKYRDNLIA
jgi:hypothetical protein